MTRNLCNSCACGPFGRPSSCRTIVGICPDQQPRGDRIGAAAPGPLARNRGTPVGDVVQDRKDGESQGMPDPEPRPDARHGPLFPAGAGDGCGRRHATGQKTCRRAGAPAQAAGDEDAAQSDRRSPEPHRSRRSVKRHDRRSPESGNTIAFRRSAPAEGRSGGWTGRPAGVKFPDRVDPTRSVVTPVSVRKGPRFRYSGG